MRFSKRILAIDPGTKRSAYVIVHPSGKVSGEILDNFALLKKLEELPLPVFKPVIEMVSCYGFPVGREVFDTVVWIGRFCQAIEAAVGYGKVTLLPRQKAKQALISGRVSNDSEIRRRVIELYGGKEKALGNKAAPGPLHDIHRDLWQALALAIAFDRLVLTKDINSGNM
jgi:hypothetical protein